MFSPVSLSDSLPEVKELGDQTKRTITLINMTDFPGFKFVGNIRLSTQQQYVKQWLVDFNVQMAHIMHLNLLEINFIDQ